jgi:hypothetical protein
MISDYMHFGTWCGLWLRAVMPMVAAYFVWPREEQSYRLRRCGPALAEVNSSRIEEEMLPKEMRAKSL